MHEEQKLMQPSTFEKKKASCQHQQLKQCLSDPDLSCQIEDSEE